MMRMGVFVWIGVISLSAASGKGVFAADLDQPKLESKLPKQLDELKTKGLLQITTLTLDRNEVIAGSAASDIMVTVGLNVPAQGDGATVQFSVTPFNPQAGGLALPQASTIKIPQGSNRATVRIRTVPNLAYPSPTLCTLTARLGERTKTINFTVNRLRILSLVALPAVGFGGFTATGTLTLNAIPAAGTTVTLTSDHPEVVRFGSLTNAQSSAKLTFNANSGAVNTFPIVVGSVPQPTAVRIKAILFNQEMTTQISVK